MKSASFDCAQDKQSLRSKDLKRGFTLVELLVVITIIAILSVIGITVFTGVQKGARDARRKADIDAIAKAMEVHYGDTTASGCTATAGTYCLPTTNPGTIPGNWFSGGQVPEDPLSSSAGPGIGSGGKCGKESGGDGIYNDHCWYCVSQSGSPDYCGRDQGYMSDSFNTVWGANLGSSWLICANLETGNPSYYCRSNQQ